MMQPNGMFGGWQQAPQIQRPGPSVAEQNATRFLAAPPPQQQQAPQIPMSLPQGNPYSSLLNGFMAPQQQASSPNMVAPPQPTYAGPAALTTSGAYPTMQQTAPAASGWLSRLFASLGSS